MRLRFIMLIVLLSGVLLIAGSINYYLIGKVRGDVTRLLTVNQPLNEIALTMKANIISTGFNVMGYLTTGKWSYVEYLFTEENSFTKLKDQFDTTYRQQNEKHILEPLLNDYQTFLQIAEDLVATKLSYNRYYNDYLVARTELKSGFTDSLRQLPADKELHESFALLLDSINKYIIAVEVELTKEINPDEDWPSARLRMNAYIVEITDKIARFNHPLAKALAAKVELIKRSSDQLLEVKYKAAAHQLQLLQAGQAIQDHLDQQIMQDANVNVANALNNTLDFLNQFLKFSSLIGVLLLSISLLLAWRIVSALINRIDKLVHAFEQVGDGQFDIRVTTETRDELGYLAWRFNKMVLALEEYSAKLRQFIVSAPTATLAVDRAGNIVLANAKALNLLGFTEQEIYQQPIENVLPILSEKALAVLDKFGMGKYTTSNRPYEMTARLANGSEIVVEVGLATIEAPLAKNEHWQLFALSDVTERNSHLKMIARHAQDLEVVNEELDRFVYIASHDMRAPLRAISNLAQWIKEDTAGQLSSEVNEKLTLITSRVNRMDALLNGLLEYSRIGRVKNLIENVDLNEVVDGCLRLIELPQGFVVRVQGQLPWIQAPRAVIDLVLRNLITNSVKHHDKPQGNILISATDETERYIQFSVQDDGPGIPPACYAKIFEMFQTLKPRDVLEGAGIGLAVVKKTLENHGAKVLVQPATEFATGAMFIIRWPKKVSSSNSTST